MDAQDFVLLCESLDIDITLTQEPWVWRLTLERSPLYGDPTSTLAEVYKVIQMPPGSDTTGAQLNPTEVRMTRIVSKVFAEKLLLEDSPWLTVTLPATTKKET